MINFYIDEANKIIELNIADKVSREELTRTMEAIQKPFNE